MSSFGDGDRYDPYAGGFARDPYPASYGDPGDDPEDEEHAPRHRRGSKVLIAAMIGTLALIVVGAVAFAGSLVMSRTSGGKPPAGKSDVAAAASVQPRNLVGGAGDPSSSDPAEQATATASAAPTTGAPTKAPTTKATTPASRPKTTAATGGGDVAYENQVISLVNVERAKAGCGPVKYNAKLRAAAYKHSADMAKRDYFSHTTPEGVEFATRIKAEGYNWSGAGENIAAGQGTPEQVMDAWMHSEGHRANILNCKFVDLGVGLEYQVKNNRKIPYWTQDFATPGR
ncbi:CAP domain-containing protein [Dactylosporangium sp. NPDC051485]|uniref:CAP domain-containing protein n=1 Tax=Dactylosporangium sp. NPDC051485 TaxID=3154846 RepID=UPI003431FEEA